MNNSAYKFDNLDETDPFLERHNLQYYARKEEKIRIGLYPLKKLSPVIINSNNYQPFKIDSSRPRWVHWLILAINLISSVTMELFRLTLNSLHKFVTEEWITWASLGGHVITRKLLGAVAWEEKRKRVSLLSLGFRRSLSCSSRNQKVPLGFSFLPALVLGFRLTCAQTRGPTVGKIMVSHLVGGAPTCLFFFFFPMFPTNIIFRVLR